MVDKLQNDLLHARRDVAEIRRQSAEEASRAEALEQQLEEATEEQRKALDASRVREEALEAQLRRSV